jgi:hypothetical protein
VTALAPLPGRDPEPDDDAAVLGAAAASTPAGTPAAAPEVSGPSEADTDTIDLTGTRPKPPDSDIAGQASWLFGLALGLVTDGAPERQVVTEVVAEAGGRSRALEGAYGRAVALLSEFPGDPLVHQTVDLLAKALLRSRRPARAAEEA